MRILKAINAMYRISDLLASQIFGELFENVVGIILIWRAAKIINHIRSNSMDFLTNMHSQLHEHNNL